MSSLPVANLADENTSLVLNEWYVAAYSNEIERSLFERTLLGISVLLFRKQDGTPIALRNRCPHRSFPFSQGRLVGDEVQCGYHGMRFRADGSCASIPAQDVIPAAVRARSFPVVEQFPLIWIWMGDSEQAGVASIPKHQWLNAADYTHVRGYAHVNCSYIRLHENLLDLTHFPFLHGAAVGDEAYARTPCSVANVEGKIRSLRTLRGHPVNEILGSMIGNSGHTVDRTSDTWFISPAFHISHATVEDLEGGVAGRSEFNFKVVHMPTPETLRSTHYFWASARDVRTDDTELSEAHKRGLERVFLEDVNALERIEDIWRLEPQFREISVSNDKASVLMRRSIAAQANKQGASQDFARAQGGSHSSPGI